ncbi:MAG: NAD(P)H-quinone oxidoreductase chain 4 1 [Pseudomonadota bacterium]|jgi:NADH-quinone oxidoreductase subunit M
MILPALLALPFAAALLCLVLRPVWSLRISLGGLVLFLLGAAAISLGLPQDSVDADTLFALDNLAAPMLPVFALVHLLSHLGTAKTVTSKAYCLRSLLATGFSALALTCHHDATLLALMVSTSALPLWELQERGGSARAFVLYMAVFCGLVLSAFAAGLAEQRPLGVGLLLLALMVRGGLFPAHSWLPVLFSQASYGTSLLYILPLMEILVVIRVVLTVIPGWMLDVAGVVCLVSAVYCGGLAMVQTQVSRFFAFLCLSQTSLVMYALLLHTPNGVTAALCLWMSAALALTGLAFSIRSIESRFGALSLDEYHGQYDQVPGLAALFLITGLASVGFPGTVGFVPMELLFGGSFEEGLLSSAAIAVATMLNGIALLRAYFALFTGKRPQTSIVLTTTWRERIGIVLITLAVFGGAWLTPSVVASRHTTAEQLLGTTPAH